MGLRKGALKFHKQMAVHCHCLFFLIFSVSLQHHQEGQARRSLDFLLWLQVSVLQIYIKINLEGQSGLGKTTFLKTLFNGEITPPLEGEYESMEILSKTESITPYIFGKNDEKITIVNLSIRNGGC